MYSSSEDSDSDSGANFKRGKRQPKEESPLKPVKKIFDNSYKPRREEHHHDRRERVERKPEARYVPTAHKSDESRTQITSQESRERPQPSKDSRYARGNRSRSRERLDHQSNNKNERRKHDEEKRKRSRSADISRNHTHRERSPVIRRVIPKMSPPSRKDFDDQKTTSRRDSQKDRTSNKAPEVTKYAKVEKDFKDKNYHKSKSPRKDESRSHRHSSSRKDSKDRNELPKIIGDEKSRITSRNSNESKKKSRSSSHDKAYGPALPPPRSTLVTEEKRVEPEVRAAKRRSDSPHHRKFGPSLPKNFQLPVETDDVHHVEKFDVISSDDDSMAIGPLPASSELSERDLELEKRKIEIKLQQLDRRMEAMNSTDTKHREEWMLELPEIKKVPDMGLTARQFRKNARPDFSDRSDWTKTPNDQHKKSSHQEKTKSDDDKRRELEMRRRDEEQEKVAKEHKKSHKREKTLVEIHEKKLKKEKVTFCDYLKSPGAKFSFSEKAERREEGTSSIQPRQRSLSQHVRRGTQEIDHEESAIAGH